MTVAELITRLQALPQDCNVVALYDGGYGVQYIECVWIAKGGQCILVPEGEVLSKDDQRPKWAPDKNTEEFWESRNE